MFSFIGCITFVILLGPRFGTDGHSVSSGSKPCEVPLEPKFGTHSLADSRWASNKQVLTYTCNPRYQIKGHNDSKIDAICQDGKWTVAPPVCLKLCRPLTPTTLDISCSFDGKKVDCDNQYSRPGTSAIARCKEELKGSSKPQYMECQDSGDWVITQYGEVNQYLFECELEDTAEQNVHTEPEKNHMGLKGYPWTSVVYVRDKTFGVFIQTCQGTLITPYLVLTAAGCVAPVDKLEDIKVGLGKHSKFRNEDEKDAVFVDVGEIVINPDYFGISSINATDLGLLFLDLGANKEGTWPHIKPVSVDWDAPVLVESGTTGYVSGWNASRSDTIVGGKMVYVDDRSCIEKLLGNKILLTRDKFCSENIDGDFDIGRGDRGGGFTVIRDGEHVIVGVLNTKLNRYNIALYTNTNDYKIKNWLKDQKDRLERRHLDTESKGCQKSSSSRECAENIDLTVMPSTTMVTLPHSKNIKSCVIPDPPDNRLFSSYSCSSSSDSCDRAANDPVSQAEVITVTCAPGHFLLQGANDFGNRSVITCKDGTWDPYIPQCYKMCPPLKSLSMNLACWQERNLVSCDKNMLPGTVAHYGCKEYYEYRTVFQMNQNRIRCLPTGEWSRELPSCYPKCGISNLNSINMTTDTEGRNKSDPGNFPWHAGLYHRKSANSWEAKCGGTLVTTQVVLTAAQCVTLPCIGCKSPVMEAKDVMVILGKLRRDWQVTEESAIQRNLREIRVYQDYIGSSLNYGQDIAVLILESKVQVNNYVMPACVDFSLTYARQLYENQQLKGYLTGWGNTVECSAHGSVYNSARDVLKYTRTNILTFNDCFKAMEGIRRFSGSRLTSDKYCAGNGSHSVVQPGDGGGGLTFNFNGRYFVYGVASVKYSIMLEDESYFTLGGFTNVTKYMDWINIQLDDMW